MISSLRLASSRGSVNLHRSRCSLVLCILNMYFWHTSCLAILHHPHYSVSHYINSWTVQYMY
jgi:hypothetical protein